jgi:flagellar basal body rod protein FlgB
MPSPAISVIDQISAAMSVRSLEHAVIASNIANRDTQGYQRLQVQFDRAMDQTRTAIVRADSPGTDPSLEQDIVALSANSAQYQTLARVLSRYLAIITTISNPNRG